ncbi:RluA family pseudouridine synthase, partial [bacterium]|nr:RluA family pseudouridine synthase [bacterium]
METYTFEVKSADAGQRVDLWLKDQLKKYSRNQIKTLLDNGKVLVNNRRVVIAGWELEIGDSVEVKIPPTGIPKSESRPAKKRNPRLSLPTTSFHGKIDNKKESAAARIDLKNIHQKSVLKLKQPIGKRGFLNVVYEDKELLVVDKPAGILSEPKADSPKEDIIRLAKEYLKRQFKGAKDCFVRPIHRLDAEASGLLILAKSGDGLALKCQFQGRQVKKEYLAVVENIVEKDCGTIRDNIQKGQFKGGRKVQVSKSEAGKSAVTEYVVKERYGDVALLRVFIQTGRTHQIRAHLSSIGHPIIGDKIYGSNISFPRI